MRKQIPLEQIVANGKNSNVMPPEMLQKLKANIQSTGHYPPLIVRKLDEKRYQLLDGHHRLLACTQLGMTTFEADVWDVTDAQADLLVATLNTIHGEQDKDKRALLLQDLVRTMPLPDLKALLPESNRSLLKLLDLSTPQAPPETAYVEDDVPVKFTCKMFKGQERVLRQALDRMREEVIADGAPSCADATALEYLAANYLASASPLQPQESLQEA